MSEKDNDKKIKRQFTGTVVSASMKNTVTVRVDRIKIHPQYKKRYTRSARYHCDCRGGDVKVGDIVVIEETRPLSKTKRHRVLRKLK